MTLTIALDGMGGVYIAGVTDSQNFIVTNAFQSKRHGEKDEAFLSKFQWLEPTMESNPPPIIVVPFEPPPPRRRRASD